ncbi:MAG: HYR domain-containing protein [Prolixibacteraceae bacterium]|nr:HYR domain-containing protein [Prolixibacteraceae bacterium]
MLCPKLRRSAHLIFSNILAFCRIENDTCNRPFLREKSLGKVVTLLVKIGFLIAPLVLLSISVQNSFAGRSGFYSIDAFNHINCTISPDAGNALLLNLTASDVTCYGGNNGSITSSFSGGSGGTVNYTLTPGSVTNTTGTFNNLVAGAYTVQANDGGNTVNSSINVTEPPATSLPSITLGAFAIYCPGAPNFLINYTATSGTPVSYSLTTGAPAMTGFVPVVNAALGASPLTVSLPAGVSKGSYQFILTVKNATGCTSTAQTFIVNFDDTTKPVFTAPNDITIFNDPTGNINVLPAVTGNVVILSDNCTSVSNLITTYSDGAHVPIGGGCNLPYTITRSWRVTDAAGNYDNKTQIITVKDNIKPNLTTPPDLALSCEQSILPASTGTATATDNCSPTTITFVDNVVNGACGGDNTITRTWTATDCSGNTSTGIQKIIVSDNTKPVATVPNISVGCPADIPVPYASLAQFNTAGGTATDNCGALSLILFNEIANGLAGKPGYCPTSVTRVYRISDPCGNYVDVVQTISVLGECGCSKCVSGTNFHLVDLLGQPTGSIEFDDQQRNGACCVESNCISFNVRLDPNAIGVEILVDGATPSPQDWRIDCSSVTINGNTICMPNGSFHLFTYCKPGANKNDFTFRSVPGVIAPGNITTRVECNSQITATGIQSNPVWNSVSPGVRGQYNSYLSSTTVANPFFVADVNSPPVIQYEVCGNVGTTVCNALGTDCAIATVYVKQKIELVWNTDPSLVCLGNMPTLTANISPAGSYSYNWYNGHGATGSVIYSGSASYKPAVVGPYSLKVTDILSGVACNTAVFDFDVVIDNVGPTFLSIPPRLSIQCGDPTANQQITNWLASAVATYTKPDGTLVNVVPTNNFTGITMACSTSLDVTFSASDQCGNVTSVNSNISVIDTQAPVFTSCPANLTVNTDAGKCYATGVNLGVPTATDNCSSVTITNNAPVQLPTGVNLVTWTATDACGNKTTCAQTVTVKDNINPVITCPATVTQTALAGNCSLSNVTIPAPVSSDNCSVVTQKWTMGGVTIGSSPAMGINDVSGQSFNVGITTVTYTLADGAGNQASCSFDVWIKDLNKPVVTSGCPSDITMSADPGLCNALVTVPKLVVNDPCNEGYTVKNSFNNTDNASGTYPVGVTTVNWTITDASGNSTLCVQKITVNDKSPNLSCPANITVNADFEKAFASNVAIAAPVYGDDCPGLSLIWSMTGATSGNSPTTGVNIFPSPSIFNLGITTIQYNATDANGHTAICSFTVTVLSKPDINCQPDISKNNDPGLCSAAFDPGFPIKLSGAEPITYTWSMSGATPTSGTASGTGPISPAPYTFNVGTTTITWTATNVSGSDVCNQVITVADKEPPVINAPGPFNFCVEDLLSAAMVSNVFKINPAPDYFLFKNGSTALDVNPSALSDNCTPSNQLDLHWQLDFSASTPTPSISGTGEPSTHSGDIFFPGDGISFTDVTHTITYWVIDLKGNESVHKTSPITIHPRPAVTGTWLPSVQGSIFTNQLDQVAKRFLNQKVINSDDTNACFNQTSKKWPGRPISIINFYSPLIIFL